MMALREVPLTGMAPEGRNKKHSMSSIRGLRVSPGRFVLAVLFVPNIHNPSDVLMEYLQLLQYDSALRAFQ